LILFHLTIAQRFNAGAMAPPHQQSPLRDDRSTRLAISRRDARFFRPWWDLVLFRYREPSVETPGYCRRRTGSDGRARDPLTARVSVFFSLFRDLVSHLLGLVERVLGPIMFADWAWRRSLFFGGLRGPGLILVLLLHEEGATHDDGDQYYESDPHALNQSRLRAKGTLLRRCADGR
jgi:hypothetical protein